MTKPDAGAADQAERSRRWRAGVAGRLAEIKAELETLSTKIDKRLTALTDRLAEPEKRRQRVQ